MHIVDVAIAFENGYGAMVEVRRLKFEMYTPRAEHFRSQGILRRSGRILGSWNLANDMVLKRLGISPRYANTMRRLMMSENIGGGSRNNFVTNLPGHRQWAPPVIQWGLVCILIMIIY